jgi:hypothetical protein
MTYQGRGMPHEDPPTQDPLAIPLQHHATRNRAEPAAEAQTAQAIKAFDTV